MRVAVVGAGAMGGVWASKLAAAGNEVAVVDAAPAVVEAINRDGLIVEENDGSVATARLRATADPAEMGPVEAVFFFTKAHQTRAAAAAARPVVGPGTTVVSLQNGWGNADTLAGVFPAEQIVMGVTYHSATVRAPGRIAHTAVRYSFVGPYQDAAGLTRAEAIAALMTAAGLETEATAGVKTEVWKKLILNCVTLPTSGLTRLPSGELGKEAELQALLDALTAEAVRVANGLGHDISLEERIETIRGVLASAGKGRSSMLQDVQAQRKTEIEVINGAVVREGDRLGIDVPLNRAMVALIHGLERSWRLEA